MFRHTLKNKKDKSQKQIEGLMQTPMILNEGGISLNIFSETKLFNKENRNKKSC